MSTDGKPHKETATSVVSVKFSDMVGQFRGNEDFSEWLKKFELVLTLQGMTSSFEKVLPLFLTGEAFAVYDGLTDKEKNDYEALKSALTKAFSPNKFSAYEAFVSRRLVQGEAVDVYLSELRRLGRLVSKDLPEEWLKCAFVNGLPDDVKLQLKAATAVDSMAVAAVVERARIILSVMDSAAGMMAKSVGGRAGEAKKPPKETRGCFICGETTHFARKCPRRRKMTCFACGEEGHRAADCPSRSSQPAKNE